MQSRIAVAAVGIPVAYLATWAPWHHAIAFTVLVLVATTLALAEFYAMLRAQRPFVPAGLVSMVLIPLLAWRAYEPGIFAGLLVVIPLTMIFVGLSVPRRDPVASIATTIMGVAYVGVAAGLVVVMRGSHHGFGLILLMFAGQWATDSAAYFVGRAIGRHKLAPRISPNKTIEGFVGGTLVGTLVVWYAHFLTTNGAEPGTYWLGGGAALAMGIAIALATTVGDLFESMLKRAAGVKDSGTLLGEHGGMLDRLDATLLVAPVTYLAAFYVGAL